jgi:pimeloyl-ACP methyl ester carboxylesterase
MHVDVNGSRLWFDVDGTALVPHGPEMRERPTVVLLHGGPGSFDHSYFKPDFGRLADVAQVVYLDLLGHGRSEWGDPASWSFELAADVVRDFCDTVGIARPILFGHSLGGFVALTYAAAAPDHPRALVLQSTCGRFDVPRVVEGFRRVGGDQVAATAALVYGGDGASVSDEEWARCRKLFGPSVPSEDDRLRMILNMELNERGLALMEEFDVLERLAVIECPTLVCAGELDPVTPVAAQRELAAALPARVARLELLEGAGHFTWKDVPEIYWPLLTEFVTTV